MCFDFDDLRPYDICRRRKMSNSMALEINLAIELLPEKKEYKPCKDEWNLIMDVHYEE